jgi:hypothetical protein
VSGHTRYRSGYPVVGDMHLKCFHHEVPYKMNNSGPQMGDIDLGLCLLASMYACKPLVAGTQTWFCMLACGSHCDNFYCEGRTGMCSLTPDMNAPARHPAPRRIINVPLSSSLGQTAKHDLLIGVCPAGGLCGQREGLLPVSQR